MGKKPKPQAKSKIKGAAPDPSTEKAKPSEVLKMIGVNDFANLVRRVTSLKKQGKEISGEMGELVSAAVENKNLDKPAFDIFRKLKGMSPQKRATTLACLYYDIDVGKLEEDETGQAEMPIPRQEVGETTTDEKDLRPPHLRSIAGGATARA